MEPFVKDCDRSPMESIYNNDDQDVSSIPNSPLSLDYSSSSSSSETSNSSPAIPKRKRGRPPKPRPVIEQLVDSSGVENETDQLLSDGTSTNSPTDLPAVPRKRGRPPGSGKKKQTMQIVLEDSGLAQASPPVKRGRGRPRKYPLIQKETSSGDEAFTDSMTDLPPLVLDSDMPSFPVDLTASPLVRTASTRRLQNRSPPTDFQIAELIKDRAGEFVSEGYTPYEVVNRLEQHFGVDLQSRFWYITEVYHVLCF